jgi:hypothetical protein
MVPGSYECAYIYSDNFRQNLLTLIRTSIYSILQLQNGTTKMLLEMFRNNELVSVEERHGPTTNHPSRCEFSLCIETCEKTLY